MILESLLTQLEQRFQYEKRAQVCLWFDEKLEFARLLPTLHTHLDQMKRPPFVLLDYDVGATHGQIWLKHRVHQVLSQAANAEERLLLRFVLYVPLSEDRLDVASDNTGDDSVRLDLLEEYRTGGVLWRIGGKRPTLFNFLRLAGVALPDSPTDQRRLWDGGRDSLLSKYVAKFADRPAVFWATQLTPELAQSRLIGDVDQTILELALEPEGTWKTLQQKGLDREFLEMVRERYGFEKPMNSPEVWIEGLVAVIALTEAFLAYGEPVGFPFADRLPPIAIRSNHRQLLKRWLRDSEYHAGWDHCIKKVEESIDLSAWAKGREGISIAFPRLIQQRWTKVWNQFKEAGTKEKEILKFFEKAREVIDEHSEIIKSTNLDLGAWSLLRDLDAFIGKCQEAKDRLSQISRIEDIASLYIGYARNIDGSHISIKKKADEISLAMVARVADRFYREYALILNQAFFRFLTERKDCSVPGLPKITAHLEQTVWKSKGKRAVIIVDGLRYDCALAIKDRLQGIKVEIYPALAILPTVTPIGMTAILPIGDESISVEIRDNNIHPIIKGKDMFVRANRMAFLSVVHADCRDIAEIETSSETLFAGKDILVVFGHDELDTIGHGDASGIVRHLHLEIDRLVRLIHRLHRSGYEIVHIVTDHGFILMDESGIPESVECDKDWCLVMKERYALVSSAADLPLTRFPFPWDSRYCVAVPPGLAFFKAGKAFSHGGASVQELIVPHLVTYARSDQETRIGVEVVLPVFELQRAVVKVVLRPTRIAASKEGQVELFSATGRTLLIDVIRKDEKGSKKSVLSGKPKELRLEDKEETVTLFFHSAEIFHKGEILELDIRDTDTSEQFPPGGMQISIGREM
jgi:hypothetical protein